MERTCLTVFLSILATIGALVLFLFVACAVTIGLASIKR